MDAVRAAIADLERREQRLREMETKCETDKAATATQCQKMLADAEAQAATTANSKKAEIANEMAKLEAAREDILKLKGRVEHDVSAVRERVKLNVGGMKFETTVSTLTKYENTYFSAAFSGRHEVPLDSEGYYFIDRDGTHFGTILNFLRTETIRMPEDRQDDLMAEVRYYALEEAVMAVSGELAPVEAPKMAEYTRREVWQMRQSGVTFFGKPLPLALPNLRYQSLTSLSLLVPRSFPPRAGGCNFAGLDLSYIDFQGCTLCGANFAVANLTRANFSKADLIYANLDGANLSDIRLTGCYVGEASSARRPEKARGVNGVWYISARQGVPRLTQEPGLRPDEAVRWLEPPAWSSTFTSEVVINPLALIAGDDAP